MDSDDPLFVAAFSALMHKTARLDGDDWIPQVVARARRIADLTRAEHAKQSAEEPASLTEARAAG